MNYSLKFSGIMISFLFFLSAESVFSEPSAKEIIKTIESKMKGTTSQGKYEITIARSRSKRTLLIESWEDSNQKKAFIKILKPKKDKGITFLKIDQNLWQYFPEVGKEIKIEGSMLQGNWMGSDMTNDDLVRATSIIDDYTHDFVNSNDQSLYKVELVPKPHAAVIWSRLVMHVRKSDILPVKQEFYDHKNRLARTMGYSEYKNMGGRIIPTIFTVKTIKGNRVISSTTLKYITVLFDRPISNYIFSRANLRR
ncbi:MAG: outer membrane lipoprotein-sorting protein [Spirochaetia bacterium]|nr:outer membrane lipoprotein-sorting protein [Spirochaetia bacterium]